MNFICPNVNVISMEDCGKCKKGKILTCPFTETYLSVVRQEAEKGHIFPSVTSLLGCLRATYFYQVDPPAINLQTMKYIFRGYVFHKAFEQYCPEQETEVQLKIQLTSDDLIYGTFDSYDSETIRDYKTVNQIIPKFIPYLSHVQQLSLYVLGLEQLGKKVKKAVIEYYDNELNMMEVEIDRSALPVEKATKMALTNLTLIKKALAEKTPPPLPDQKELWRCQSCSVKTECQKDLLERKL